MKSKAISVVALLALVGCKDAGKNSGDDAAAPASTSSAQAVTSASPQMSAAPKKASAPAVRTDLQAKAADKPLIMEGMRSNVPTVAEYKAQTEPANVVGARELDCETRLVREWLRVSCRGTTPGRGTARRVTVVKGDTMEHTHHVFSDGDVASLVMRFEPGVDLKAVYTFTTGEHVFETRWPVGAKEPEVKGFFDGGSVKLDEAPAPSDEAPAVAGQAPYGKRVADRSTVPTEQEYALQFREVIVTNSTLLQCETKKVREWLRVKCFGTNDARGSADAVRVLTGSDRPDVFAFKEADAATLIMPFVPNTRILAEFEFSKGKRLFNSRWTYGDSEPERCGWF